ncbi:hypothetical protein MTR62_04845 [Novosphingobium sp. 1949]|uniref:Uncharacterized protein n=1 Tax=Novosphingobium organovorum TaxID=2930092 RepID=A0ABT0BAE4_9SPHN|nr:hypothetical protein [Novosphingobium organovorum]MCJ2182032.1 hypothetical protein [Novosphingobium organovorum]
MNDKNHTKNTKPHALLRRNRTARPLAFASSNAPAIGLLPTIELQRLVAGMVD